MNQVLDIDGQQYDVVPDEARIATEYLIRVKDKIGIPEDAKLEKNNTKILSYAFQIYKVWSALYPEEHREFLKETEFELKYERPVKDAIKAGGYSPLAYPARLDRMFQILLPEVKTQDKKFWEPLLRNIPELKRTNYFH